MRASIRLQQGQMTVDTNSMLGLCIHSPWEGVHVQVSGRDRENAKHEEANAIVHSDIATHKTGCVTFVDAHSCEVLA